ncbi:hypothetical protein D3C87_838200 [compost metagenome]|uniref:DUF3347 domain-containing protein n=1 Tax=Pedobacter ghigonis TaxID=2730403 RepID=UPI000FA0886F|nr:DUF3347 domain-containing protein [Pedobacter ghigonis]
MKFTSKIWMVIVLLLSATSIFAQIKNAQTASLKVFGNCEMCKKTIEAAGNLKGISKVEWNKTSKIATVTYDEKKTDTDEILKRIALAGYDNERFLAPADAYAKLEECCRYERAIKLKTQTKESLAMKEDNHKPQATRQNASPLKPVFDAYFSVKDAMVKSDGNTTAGLATQLLNAIKKVEMDKLTTAEHTVWMAGLKEITADAESISKLKEIAQQRQFFSSLSKSIYQLAKIVKQDSPVYYQHCPMYNSGKGANWLSKEAAIKNPYYGSKMMTCGSIVETLN